jgi:hypothetical protein
VTPWWQRVARIAIDHLMIFVSFLPSPMQVGIFFHIHLRRYCRIDRLLIFYTVKRKKKKKAHFLWALAAA